MCMHIHRHATCVCDKTYLTNNKIKNWNYEMLFLKHIHPCCSSFLERQKKMATNYPLDKDNI
jgi:hypothetical protein